MGLVSNSLRTTLNLKLSVSGGVKIEILQNSTVAERAGETGPTGSHATDLDYTNKDSQKLEMTPDS